MPVEWLEFHSMISEVVERLKVGVEADLEANWVSHCCPAETIVLQPQQQVDFAIDFGNLLPMPSAVQTT